MGFSLALMMISVTECMIELLLNVVDFDMMSIFGACSQSMNENYGRQWGKADDGGNQTQTNLFIRSIQIRLWDAEAAGRHTRCESDESAPKKCSVDSFCPQVCCSNDQTSSLA
jgi:hypothetical protein